MNIQARCESLQEYIKSGRIMEAMNEFYAPDLTMQENAKPPTHGLAANIEREKQFLSQVKQWKGYTVKAIGFANDVSLVESRMEFVNTAGQSVTLEQVSVQRWKNGKIVNERFYYDTGK